MRTDLTPVFVIVLGLVGGGCERRPANPSIATRPTPAAAGPGTAGVPTTFAGLELITPEPVYVNLELALLCRGVSQQDVASARARFGPHANTRVNIYMNDAAARAFRGSRGGFPVGALIVKEKKSNGYFPAGVGSQRIVPPDGVGGMIKRADGYDREHGDWEYFYYEDPSKIERGRISSCVQCHAGAAETDYVFGHWSKGPTRHRTSN